MSSSTAPAGEPFFLPGGPTGCLLVHGFTGSPAEMRGLGEHLAAQGHTVSGVRLTGHGGTPEELHRTSRRDWYAAVECGFDQLREHCARIVVIGFSLGGALAVLLAVRRTFARLIMLATPLYAVGGWVARALPVARYVVPWYYPLARANFNDPFVQQRIREHAPEADPHDPRVQAQIRRSVRISLRAVAELQATLRRAEATLPKVGMPTLVMHGRDDETAPPGHAEHIMARLGSAEKELVWWEQTGHQLLVSGPAREAIFARVATFIPW